MLNRAGRLGLCRGICRDNAEESVGMPLPASSVANSSEAAKRPAATNHQLTRHINASDCTGEE